MRAFTSARSLVASAALALLAPLVAAASLSPSLASDDPMQVDLLLNVTRPGAVTVVLWEDGYEGGVNGHPLALTLDAGAVDAASIAAAEDAAASVATNQLGAGVEPYAALLDEVTHDPVADATVAAPCCAPNRTWHLRAPASASAPAILYTTRNGTHEWDSGSYPPNLPRVLLALELGREDSDELNSGFTLERSNALRDAVADAARARVADVVPKVTEPGKLSHRWAPSVLVVGYKASNFNPDLSAGLTRREIARESFAGALGVPLATTTVASVTDEDPGDGSGSDACRFAFIVSGIADPAEVARAWPEVETAAFAADVTSRMKSNGLSSTATAAGSSGAGVTATLTVEVRARDEGSWIRLANGAGILAGDLEKAMEGFPAELRTPVAGATRTVVAADGSAPALPRDAPIRDSGPLSRYDVVHPIGEARRMTVLVVRVNEANIPTTGHVVRVSFHNQRPGTDVRALVLDGSAGGDDPWMSSAYVMLSRPPSPPPVPFPPPRVEGLETRITAGPAENSISPLGTIFRFQFEPTPSCLECGLPQGTVVHVRVAREPELQWGPWRLATAVDVETVVLVGGVNVTRMVKRYEYAHWPQSNGAYRAQAKSIDATLGGTGLEDTTPAERRYVVGAKVTGEGVLDRRTGILTVTFSRDVPFSDDDAADADRIFNPASLATMGPGEIRAAWTSPNILRVILPEARRSGLCAAWRAVRADTLAEALAGNTPDVPVREWVRPEDVDLPEDFHLEFGGIDAWYPRDSGFSVDPRLRVRMGAETGAETETGVKISGPRDVGGCQRLELEASRADGAWDGEIAWRLVSVDPSRWPGVPRVDPSDLGPLNVTVAAANADGATRLSIPPSRTVVDQTYAFAADVTSCDGTVTNATFTTRRKRGPVPNLRPTTGDDAYETTRARSLTVSMEVSLPDVTSGSECDADASRLTYAWTNLTAPAPCLYTDVRSAVYDGYELEPRATRRSLTIPPFCLAASDAPHGFKLTASFGGEASSSATEILVTVRRTPLVAVLRGGAGPRKIQKGTPFPLDASGSYDPDASRYDPDASTDPATPSRARYRYRFFCALVTETETPCPAAIDAALAEANALGNVSVVDGDRLGRAFRIGDTYRFTVTYSVGDVASNASATVSAVRDAIPTVVLATPDPPEVASTDTLRLVGSVERPPGAPDGELTLSWSSDPPVDFTRRERFDGTTGASSLAIRPGTLLPDTVYVFTLVAAREGVAAVGSASTGPILVVGPPTPGRVFATPSAGTALETEFVVAVDGWGGASAVRYTVGYVARGPRGEDVEVALSTASSSTEIRGVRLPANVTRGGVTGDVRLFAYAETSGRARARMRIEGTVRVQPTRAGDETDAATNAMDAAARVGDAEMRAAAAVTAAASLNAVPLDVRGDDDDAKIAARRSVRERAMTLVAEAAEGTLSDVAADENFIVEPDVVRAYVSAVAAVSASPEETTKAAAATGVEIVAGVLRAKTARPTPLDVLDVAAAALDAAMTVVAVEGSRSARPNATSDVTGDAASERATTTEWLAAASSGKRRKSRRLLEDANLYSDAGNATTSGNATPPPPPTPSAPPDARVVVDPLVALALDATTAVATATTRGRSANETAGTFVKTVVATRGSRLFPTDVASRLRAVTGPHPGSATYAFPPSFVASVENSGTAHVDVFEYRVGGEVLPSATRMMTDGSAVDVRLDDGTRPYVDPEEEVVALVPFTGSGLIALEKVIYEYRCARHSGGVWVLDESVVRTAAVEETAPGEGRVTCAGKGGAMFGYLVGVVIAPIDFTLTENDRLTEETMNVYWYVMGGTAATAVLFGVQGLKRGMRRYTVKVANSDNAVTN